MKRLNLRIIVIENGEETQFKSPEKMLSTKSENTIFYNLKKTCLQRYKKLTEYQEIRLEKKVPLPHNNHNTKHAEQKRKLKSASL